jgi:hypothetical protein
MTQITLALIILAATLITASAKVITGKAGAVDGYFLKTGCRNPNPEYSLAPCNLIIRGFQTCIHRSSRRGWQMP